MTLRKRTVARRLSAGAAVVAALALAIPPQAGYALAPKAQSTLKAAHAQSYSVTLITGDRVQVNQRADGTYAVAVAKGAGREKMPFASHRTKTGLVVVPADAIGLIASKKLEERLFDVVLLKKLGYDDAHSTEIPLLTSAPRGAKLAAPAALAGTRTVRTIPGFGVTSVKAAKRDAASFWRALTGAHAASFAPTIDKVRLNGMLKPTLDESANQIGAPEAWAAGHTGAGATVAIVDTGVDAEHPDLKGVVTDAKDFTNSPEGVKDEVGHGTHVASIIAGRGTASDGKYTGIAKGAELKSAKVCLMQGCTEDAILAGMDWAANSGAKVINMSLGGPPAETGDILEEAVDYYTATNGVLFVIAAGNSGAPETIGSPGTADSALTVGSVDKKTDALSFFSSQGPRVTPSRRLDYAIKPDITAPGYLIVAARAAGTDIGEPVGENYTTLSGTSMATPHVAGSAAIVAAQHPTWRPAQLKAALTSTSKAIEGQTVYQQGAGRVDIGRASTQPVTSTGILNLGYFPWPNAGASPATQSVIYANDGTVPVTLDVTLAVKDDKGQAAATGMFKASAKKVTIAAGKTATVDVTINPRRGTTGLYSGVLSAVSADGKTAVHSAVGAYKEPESYNLSLTQLNHNGGKGAVDIAVINQKTGEAFFELSNGTSIKRMPAGDYTVMTTSYAPTNDSSGEYDTVVEARNVKLTKSADLLFDARKGKPIKVTLDKAGAVLQGLLLLSVGQATPDGDLGSFVMAAPGHLFTVPTVGTIKGLDYSLTCTFVKDGTGHKGEPASPYTYNIVLGGSGKFPTGSSLAVKKAEMAVVHQTINRQSADEQRDMIVFGRTPTSSVSFAQFTSVNDLAKRDDYFTPGKDSLFETSLVSGSLTPDGWNEGEYVTSSQERSYDPRSVSADEWNLGVFGPAAMPDYPARYGDDMIIALALLSDRNHLGGPGMTDTGYTKLLRDGKVVAESEWPGYLEAQGLPKEEARYTLTTSSKRGPAWADLSRDVEATWSFTSKHVDGDQEQAVALQAVRYSPKLDRNNSAPGSKAFTFGVRVDGNTGDTTLTSLAVEVSYDAGKTWIPAALTGSGAERTASVKHPASGTVSLRAKAVNSAGDSVEQTIINAYNLR